MIIVTGANGFIGSAMFWQLNEQGQSDLVGVDTLPLSQHNLLKNRRYTRFLLKNELWSYLKTAEAKKISWVIHMGACSSTTEKNWDFLQENNLEYSQKIFSWCAQEGKNLIYASSAATYGAGENGFDDLTPPEALKPLNLYGKSKLLMDEWALQQTSTPPHWYGLKFFNVFGPNECFKAEMASLVYKAYDQIISTGQLKLFKSHRAEYQDGEQKRDFIYVKEVIAWMAELMQKTPRSGVYNMGTGQARTWNALAAATFSALKKEKKIEWLDMPPHIKDQYQYFTEAKMNQWHAAGLSSPKWTLEAAVTDYVQNYLLKGQATL